MGNNDWMNDQLRALTGTKVNSDEAGAEINAALRGQPSPSRVKQGKTKVDPEPPPTSNIKEWQTWAAGVEGLLDDQGRMPGEQGYTRPATDSFSAKGRRNGRWSAAHREAGKATRRSDANRTAS
jgi:hypothetical protein